MNYLKNLDSLQKAFIALIIANLIWGASFPIYKWTLEDVPIFTFAFLRFFIGALILFPFVINRLKIARQDYKDLFLISIFSVTFLIPFMFYGLKLSPSINAPIIISSAPIILIASSIIFLKEKVNIKILAGTLISLSGVLLILFRPLIDSGIIGGIFGNLFIFIATIFSVIQIILLKTLTERNNPITIIFWSFLIGSLPFLPLIYWESQSYNLVTDMTMRGILGILFGVFLATVVAHILLAFGTKRIHASEVGIFSYINPLTTIIVAIPLLGEKITTTYLIGSILVFVGIFIAESRIIHYHPFSRLFKRSEKTPPLIPTP